MSWLLALFILILLVLLILVVVLHLPRFGALPAKHRKQLRQALSWKQGAFHNQLPTPPRTEGTNSLAMYVDYFFVPKPRLKPEHPLPAVKTDLHNLENNQVIWFGHSSFLLRLDGLTFLVDPVFSTYAAPFSFSTQAFPGTSIYSPADMPPIDYVVLSHDHWDHLDCWTLNSLRNQIGHIFCPLGVESHLKRWGFGAELVTSLDWYGSVKLAPAMELHFLPSRHFSGRDLRWNRTLWGGWAWLSQTHRIVFTGDGGYGPHFTQIGQQFGGFDLALVENGQYDKSWKDMHMLPEEGVQAALDLGARAVMPVHWGRFAIANHPWDDPPERFLTAAQTRGTIPPVTPRIGEPVLLQKPFPAFEPWWR